MKNKEILRRKIVTQLEIEIKIEAILKTRESKIEIL